MILLDLLDYTFNKYNNTVHRTIKMKPVDVTVDSYAEYNEDFNKFLAPNWSEVFVVSKIKNAVP